MGTGVHGGFGDTAGSKLDTNKDGTVSLPKDRSKLDHIFGDRPGHLPDTPENRQRLTDLAQDSSKYIGEDQYGNSWNAQINPDGTQDWVRYRDGTINEGGRNAVPRVWDPDTGLNNNPFRGGRK